MKIAVVGTGYVGLVSGACFAEMGLDITCVDVDRKKKIDALNNGLIPIYEPGLEELVKRNVEEGRLHFTTELTDCLDKVEVVFSAVGTPPDEDGSADLKYVLEVARAFGRNIKKYTVLVTKKHRTRRYGAEGQGRDPGRDRQTRLQDTVRRGLEPRIPEGRRGHQGFHVARPRGRRRRERTGAQADDPPVPSVPDQQFPGAVHGHPLGGNDQIRGQRHAGDPHFVHERDRQSLRPGRGERRNGAQRASDPTPASAASSSTPAAATAARASPRT